MNFSRRNPIKIVINALSARQGGGQTYLVNLLEHLQEDAAIEVHVLAPKSLAVPENRRNIHRLRVSPPGENPFTRAIWEKVELPRILSKLRTDVLFCPGGIIATRVPSGCKTVTMFRNMIPFSAVQKQKYGFGYMRLRNALLKGAFLRSMQSADLVIFLSEYAKSVIEAESRKPIRKTVTIPHGISARFRKSSLQCNSAMPGWLPAEGYFLYASTLDYYKGQLEVVRAYRQLKQQRYTPQKLILAGPEYPEYGRLVREEVRKLRLEDDVLIPGTISYEDMAAVYRHATVNIFASECENCPNILIEALASGRPVLSSNCGPMPEIAGHAAEYFDPRSPAELAGKWVALLDDPPRMNKLAGDAEDQSRQYDWSTTAQRTWRAMQDLVDPTSS